MTYIARPMTLFEAVESRDAAQLKAAVAATKDVNELGAGKTTPLIRAAASGWLEGVKVLLEAGADTDWRDEETETALLKAAANGHLEVARLLAPKASEEDRALASSFLKALTTSQAPEYQYDGGGLKRKAAEVAARAAHFVGHDEPLERLERQERAEANQKKKR